MRVCKHGCDITRISIGYALSNARFDWLVQNVSSIFHHLSNYFRETFYKSNRGMRLGFAELKPLLATEHFSLSFDDRIKSPTL